MDGPSERCNRTRDLRFSRFPGDSNTEPGFAPLATEEKPSVFRSSSALAVCYSHESLTCPEHLCNIQTSNRQLDSSKPHAHDLSQGHVISLEEHPQSAWFCAPALPLPAKVILEGADPSVPQFFSQ